MTFDTACPSETASPLEEIDHIARRELTNAIHSTRSESAVYESVRNLNEILGTQYGDRVLYELIQNAHDAHLPGDSGVIAVRLNVHSHSEGTLYVANGGAGFTRRNLQAIRNIATSDKQIGAGIGNKGIGFRSVEALTDDPRIYSRSQVNDDTEEHFSGFCFRFATPMDMKTMMLADGIEANVRDKVAATTSRYMIPRPIHNQSEEIVAFRRAGYATVIEIPLRTEKAVKLAIDQVEILAGTEAPLLLFLNRIEEVIIETNLPERASTREWLTRKERLITVVPSQPKITIHEVTLGEGRKYLLARSEVGKERVLAAVKESIQEAPELKRWLNWQGEPTVAVAVQLNGCIIKGRLYNFLPMGERAKSPFAGYLDAPFFTEVDRRDANLDLPLNEILMRAAAETCAAAALFLADQRKPIPANSVLDLVAWSGPEAHHMDDAFLRAGTSLSDAPIIPAIGPDGTMAWSCLKNVCDWPREKFTLLRPKELARHSGASLVADLGDVRLRRLTQIAKRAARNSLYPEPQLVAAWAESFAAHLHRRKMKPRTWSFFYRDLYRAFSAIEESLCELTGRDILLDRSGKLRKAGEHGEGKPVYVRGSKVRRTKDGTPLPPAKLMRRFLLLEERIDLGVDTRKAFLDAGLLREYDPVEALAGLGLVLGANVSATRRSEALTWAYEVWKSCGEKAIPALEKAGLYVPTFSGWRPAREASFSADWTTNGRVLEEYLHLGTEESPDCREAWYRLLAHIKDWPWLIKEPKKKWKLFLEAAGVTDGLRPVPCPLRGRNNGGGWNWMIDRGKPESGFGKNWIEEVASLRLSHPNTSYQRKGEAWRLPGQIEHERLPNAAKEAFCKLTLALLAECGDEFMSFQLGRFNRTYPREYDKRILPTPLGSFLRLSRWVAAETNEGIRFTRTDECWSSRGRRAPSYMARAPEAAGTIIAADPDFAFGQKMRLRDWADPSSAGGRLADLAKVAPTLTSSDRPSFRKEYARAWQDLVKTGCELPRRLDLAVSLRGRMELLQGNLDNPPTLIVAHDSQNFEARTIARAGHPILEVGKETPRDSVATILNESGCFCPRMLDGIGVQLLVDEERFVPSATDPVLMEGELDWLPETLVIINEIGGEHLEQMVSSALIAKKARSVRVRHCERICLMVDGEAIHSDEQKHCYGFEHEDLPTLILTSSIEMNMATLAVDVIRQICRIVDKRLRTPENTFLRLAQTSDALSLEYPGDEALARALDCDVQAVREQRLALRADIDRILEMVRPIIAFFGGIEAAKRLSAEHQRNGTKINLREWIEANLPECGHSPEGILKLCREAGDRAEVRRRLGIDYAAFNETLTALGETPISNEESLRRSYDAYLQGMRQDILDRLRRTHFQDFKEGADLRTYVERKSLSFLPFNPDWVRTHEELDPAEAGEYVDALLDAILGEDRAVQLQSLMRILDHNKKEVRAFTEAATPVVAAWCRKNSEAKPSSWADDDLNAVARQLDDFGLLDFTPIDQMRLPSLCVRAGLWPTNMPATLDMGQLGLTSRDVATEARKRKIRRAKAEIDKRSIEFAGVRLDTGASDFANAMREIAERNLEGSDEWYKRSRSPRLTPFQDRGRETKTRGSGGGRQRNLRLTEDQKNAMGLASEWLAFRYLLRLHKGVDETCWISRNRRHFFGGKEGDDWAGFDFRVVTPATIWHYEVKSSLDDGGEFEMTANEMRIAGKMAKEGKNKYRILYVPYVFTPDKWRVLRLPNPLGEKTRDRYKTIGQGAVRMRFERQ